ncbi:hypothetical protein OGAPHI_005667 [Ogataea philodendri]|uniref:ADP-ribose 1''-phosphate phosphatase n=1 Tax=Ogataea philodendri TaxID=1378263 RepID=A0A9P8NZ75_9ASCO|nr:uncharacterized protein OGAPHI_005667 [Ogataea philodendri]KAH3662415.1 hypothetical protein OGAPHI_005667 [Ogataea philodendri]
MSINYVKGNLFRLAAKPATEPVYLAHACNCLGVWGGGIAAEFRRQFQSTYKVYHEHCLKYKSDPSELLGTALIIPADRKDSGYVSGTGDKLSVVCLFTSVMGGESPEEIAKYTELAMQDLKTQLSQTTTQYVLAMPKINAGIFGVPWSLTERALTAVGVPCTVYEL